MMPTWDPLSNYKHDSNPRPCFLVQKYRRGREEMSNEATVRRKICGDTQLQKVLFDAVKCESCYYIIFDGEKCAVGLPDKENLPFKQLFLNKASIISDLLGDNRLEDYGLSNKTKLEMTGPGQMVLEVGPRVNVVSPTCTNIVNIFQAMGVDYVIRVEISRLYHFTGVEESDRSKIANLLHDPMIEEIYGHDDKVKSGMLAMVSRPPCYPSWKTIKLGENPSQTLRDASNKYGLGFDDQDIEMYVNYYASTQKDPTDVELFDLAQSNSEHSRHWLFNGKYILDGETLPKSLFQMVKETNQEQYTEQNNVIKFSDNSSAIKGYDIDVLKTTDQVNAPVYELIKEKTRHLVFTAETHNFPTAIEPFNGAATGTGGRIRDNQATGKGAHTMAGTAGYCTGNLHIPYHKSDFEKDFDYKKDFASPLNILIQASDGASDYGNKFGEPIIQGFVRTYGDIVGQNDERREWVKPVMFTGGVGSIDEENVDKDKPLPGMMVAKIGGPAYKIGLGGGVASSIQVQGDNESSRDLSAVQRGDPEMEQKMNRVIRRCIESSSNPIISIHDQGAGGNANVLKELIEGVGGILFAGEFTKGDQSMSILELWVSEYQESNAVVVIPKGLQTLEAFAARERCTVDSVGIVYDINQLLLLPDKFNDSFLQKVGTGPLPNLPVNISFGDHFTKCRKEFNWTKKCNPPKPLDMEKILANPSVDVLLKAVLKLPAVASKRFLTNKVDRSVTGLIAQQQCVGPLHTPVADVAVTALSYFDWVGTAISIGEQPIKMLVNPKAGARMSVLEAITNIISAPIRFGEIKCSANWMWPGKVGNDGYEMYEACKAMCDFMQKLGIAIDGGKDSLSMAARVKDTVVKSPGELVISAYARCHNIDRILTPDIKGPNEGQSNKIVFIKLTGNHRRLGGSALAQAFNTLGDECPDVDPDQAEDIVACFRSIQSKFDIYGDYIKSIHDVSDGGLITTLVEMAVSGWGGMDITLNMEYAFQNKDKISQEDVIKELFSEEPGWVLELQDSRWNMKDDLPKSISYIELGYTTDPGASAQFIIRNNTDEVIFQSTVLELAKLWEKPSYLLECLQKNSEVAEEEYEGLANRKNIKYKYEFDPVAALPETVESTSHKRTHIVAVIREEGTNGDREMAAALYEVGFQVFDVTMTDLLSNKFDLDPVRGICFPGGFSFADVMGSAKGWAAVMMGDEKLMRKMDSWRMREDTFSLGVCNGCQLMAHLGWIDPTKTIENRSGFSNNIQLETNLSMKFESRWSYVKIEKSSSILLSSLAGSVFGVWVANKEGRFTYQSEQLLDQLKDSNLIALSYVDEDHNTTETYPLNPSGSQCGVAGIVSKCGRHLAMMPHPERSTWMWQWPYKSNFNHLKNSPWIRMFRNGYDWCCTN